jgi:hypothetical protein
VKTEPARANQSQPEPARASQSQPEPARATQSHTEPLGATQSQPDEARAQNDGSSTVIPRASARRTTVLLLLYRARLVEHDFESTQSHPEPPRASQSQPYSRVSARAPGCVCAWLRMFFHNKGYAKEMSAPWLI